MDWESPVDEFGDSLVAGAVPCFVGWGEGASGSGVVLLVGPGVQERPIDISSSSVRKYGFRIVCPEGSMVILSPPTRIVGLCRRQS